MNGSSEKPNHQSTSIPSKHVGSTAFKMKATYQRNMLIGMLAASILVILPALVWAWWIPAPNTGDKITIIKDTVSVAVDFDPDYLGFAE